MPTRFGITPLMVAAGLDYWEGEARGLATDSLEPLDAPSIVTAFEEQSAPRM